MYDPAPYTAAVGALQDKYGQPRQLVQSELGAILNSPAIKSGDADAFDSFALSVQSLVGMLRTLEGPRDGFVEYCLVRGILQPGSELTYSLPDFAAWLQMKAQAKRLASRATLLYNSTGRSTPKREQFRAKPRDKTASVFLCTRERATKETTRPKPQAFKLSPYCPFCNNKEHYLNSCLDFKKLSPAEIKKWIQEEHNLYSSSAQIWPICSHQHSPSDQAHLAVPWQSVQGSVGPCKFLISVRRLQPVLSKTSGLSPSYRQPLNARQPVIPLCASPAAVMPNLRCTERRLAKDTVRAASYCTEMDKLLQAGYVSEISTEEAATFTESCGDIKSMFHQIRLMPKDKPLLRFLWRDMQRTSEPRIYQWEVLPFGTTCSPCCAVFALQQHVRDHEPPDPPLTHVIEQSFYVDNCLHSVSKPEDAKALVDDLRALLRKGGFEIRQWASNVPEVVAHLPPEAQSTSSELWLSKASDNLQEPTLGLCRDCLSDTLSYKHRSNEPLAATLRNVYSVLAKLYDPLGYIVPFTTRCKVLVQDMWKANIGWDDKIQPSELLGKWLSWVQEIPTLQQLKLSRPYSPASGNTVNAARHIHIFCDASERAYGSVAYMQITDDRQQVFVSFVFARSRVAPRKQLSIPRLELSAALTGAQLAKVIETELTVTPEHITLWSDSTTVLYWIKSESCRYKVFVGTRVAEIQNLTSPSQWRYVGSLHNPADDITRGLTLKEMVQDHRWNKGPHFLLLPEREWPIMPSSEAEPDTTELRKSAFVGAVSSALPTQHPDLSKFSTWQELLQETASSLHGAANTNTTAKCSATDFLQAEKLMT
ncbi:uncharacterized protein LOC119118836 [Syngnathus acus]|uniref:uncharacterized protein LOC119118391 n=1 Tax=Syngnathus acus TaxID=161584 RepID=UPI001885BABA|nr:uncharacterized protein LOC119118391 [Syngnathus acus]XP_037101515.1 uncharacterized protein LOC119118836 [Syngnathus acus]